MSQYTNSAWTAIQTNMFIYDGWLMVTERSMSAGTVVTNWYTWGLDISGSLQGAGGVGGLRAWTRSSDSKTLVYCHDANGNVCQLVDKASKAIVASYKWDAYGNLLSMTGTESTNNSFRFSTKYFDSETGLGNWGRRYYHPDTGRWVCRDPKFGVDTCTSFTSAERWNCGNLSDSSDISSQTPGMAHGTDTGENSSSAEGANLYTFLGNEAIGNVDALGLCKIDLQYNLVWPTVFSHAYLVMTWEDGQQTYYRGGPTPSLRGWGSVHAEYGDYGPGGLDWNPEAPSLNIIDDCKPCTSYHWQLLASIETLNARHAPYRPFGRNSNTVAHWLAHILTGSHISPPFGIRAPSWDMYR